MLINQYRLYYGNMSERLLKKCINIIEFENSSVHIASLLDMQAYNKLIALYKKDNIDGANVNLMLKSCAGNFNSFSQQKK